MKRLCDGDQPNVPSPVRLRSGLTSKVGVTSSSSKGLGLGNIGLREHRAEGT